MLCLLGVLDLLLLFLSFFPYRIIACEDGSDALSCPGHAGSGGALFVVEDFGDLGVVASFASAGFAVQISHVFQGFFFRRKKAEVFLSHAFTGLATDALPGRTQFEHDAGFLEFGDGTEHLADQGFGGVTVGFGKVGG